LSAKLRAAGRREGAGEEEEDEEDGTEAAASSTAERATELGDWVGEEEAAVMDAKDDWEDGEEEICCGAVRSVAF
jgi:hypothetical protein